MSAAKPGASYVVHFKTGRRSKPITAERVRALIASGRIGVDDLLSRDGGPPSEFYQYDEFVDLWEVGGAFDFILSGDVESVGASASPPSPLTTSSPSLSAESAEVSEAPSFQGRVEHEDLPEFDSLPGLDEMIGADDDEGYESDEGVADGVDSVSSFAEAAEPPDVDSGDFAAGSLFDEPAGLSPYIGYDPLGDMILDAVTVRDLLYDSSLYTVLAANPNDSAEEIEERYLARAGLMARRQRELGRSDRGEVAAMKAVRHLVYLTYRILADDAKRADYVDAARRALEPLTAAQYLGLTESAAKARPNSERLFDPVAEIGEPDDSGEAAPLVRQPSDDAEAVGERGATLDLTGEHDGFGDDPFGIGEELSAPPLRDSARHSITFDDGDSDEVRAPGDSLPEGLRIYSSVSEAIDSGTYEYDVPVGEIFDREAPRRARLEQERAERRYRRMGLRTTSTRSAIAALDQQAYPEGQRWGVDNTPAPALTQAIGLTGLAFFVSLVVVFITDQGAMELDYSGNSLWFWGRGLLLVALAVVGTVVVRGESALRLGFMPPVIETSMGAGLGVVLGVVGSLVAPVYLDPEASMGLAILAMGFIALAHELFFRGFVTRVLLVGMPSVVGAVITSCLIYGLFYLSYSAVLGQQGFWVMYYSVLLYGFGLGSILGILYWKSHSIWPSTVVHFLVLVLAMMLAP